MARPREFDRDETLDKALQIFWTNGYKSTSLSKLVSGLGVNRASVYNTYGNKRVFFAAALDHYLKNRIPNIIAPLEAEGSIEDRLRKFLTALIELGSKTNHYRGCFVIGSLSELSVLEPELAKLCRETLTQLEKKLQQVVKQAQAQHEIRTDIPANDLTTLILSTTIGLMTKARTKQSLSPLKSAVESTLRLLRPLS